MLCGRDRARRPGIADGVTFSIPQRFCKIVLDAHGARGKHVENLLRKAAARSRSWSSGRETPIWSAPATTPGPSAMSRA